MRTVLGRSSDYGNNLVDTSAILGADANKSLSGLLVQTDHLAQLSIAMNDFSTSIAEISHSTVNSNQHVTEVSNLCKGAIDTITQAEQTVSALAKEVEKSAQLHL